jgi:antitoxin component of MazEF toxin-antitoxin module
MRLQKQLSRKIGNTEYAKFVTVIPPQVIKDLGWEDGQELESEIKEGRLVIKKRK